MKNRFRTPKRALVIIGVAVLLGILLLIFIFMNGTRNGSESNTGLYPQNGTYTITNAGGITCRKTFPPVCEGSIELTPGDIERLGAEVDGDTKVRYESKEVQIYPNSLERGMSGVVTFRPNSAVIDEMVIAE